MAVEAADPAEPAASPELPEVGGKKGWTTGAKVAVGVSGAIAVGGLAVAGALFGGHVAEHGWDATMAGLGDDFHSLGDEIAGVAVVAGDHISTGATDAVHWVEGAGHDTGAFIMDLF